MSFQFNFEKMESWPPLTWLAITDEPNETIVVRHDPGVETRDRWFCEAVWAGDFDEGGFDRTDIVAGSGGRLRSGRVIFVSAGSTVDRLHSMKTESRVWFSNSLCCLLSSVQATVDAFYPHFHADLSIVQGLASLKTVLRTSGGPVRLTYFHNLIWDGHNLAVTDKPFADRDFAGFAQYRNFLAASMHEVHKNMSAPTRQFPLSMLGTLSRGYDSPTVAVLAREAGCQRVLCFDQSIRNRDDNGAVIAPYLGLEPTVVMQDAWREYPLAESVFVAADCKGEDVYWFGAKEHLAGKVIMTGYYGSRAWDKEIVDTSEKLRRGDRAGLSLCEFRLRAGFLHCPVPFWGGRNIARINAISNSTEMTPWDIAGYYSRPIARRIVEEAGVPRELFGFRKNAASVHFRSGKDSLTDKLTPRSRRDFILWLAHRRGMRGKLAAVYAGISFHIVDIAVTSVWAYLRIAENFHFSRLVNRKLKLKRHIKAFSKRDARRVRRYYFPWGVERSQAAYELTPKNMCSRANGNWTR